MSNHAGFFCDRQVGKNERARIIVCNLQRSESLLFISPRKHNRESSLRSHCAQLLPVRFRPVLGTPAGAVNEYNKRLWNGQSQRGQSRTIDREIWLGCRSTVTKR